MGPVAEEVAEKVPWREGRLPRVAAAPRGTLVPPCVPCSPLAVAFAAGIGALALLQTIRRRWSVPDAPAVAQKIREVAKLEALEVTLYKKVSFAPDPTPQGTAWADVLQWVHYSVHPPQGRAIVFARAHLGYDLASLDGSRLALEGDRVSLRLPPLQCQIELLPAETEVVSSSLDSAQTAELLEKARLAFRSEALADPELRARAERSVSASIRALLYELGFRHVEVGPGPTG